MRKKEKKSRNYFKIIERKAYKTHADGLQGANHVNWFISQKFVVCCSSRKDLLFVGLLLVLRLIVSRGT